MGTIGRAMAIVGWVALIHQILIYIAVYKRYKRISRPSSLTRADDIVADNKQETYNQHIRELKIKQQKKRRKSKSRNVPQDTKLLLNIPLYGSSVYLKRGTNSLTNLERLHINCEKLIQGDPAYVKKTKMILAKHKKVVFKPKLYMSLAKSCDKLIKSRGYVMNVSKEESEFPIAYNIIMHHDIEMAERLLRSIYRPSNIYCIHVDGKSPINLFNAMSSLAKCFDNVFMASHRSTVRWGQYSVFQAELTCMDDLLKYKKWKYFINLAGQDFPLKTNLGIVRILRAFRGANSISGAPFSGKIWKSRMSKTGAPLSDIVLKKGSQHILASRKFITYIRTAPKALEFAEWLKKAKHPHETFFNSLYFSRQLNISGCYKGKKKMLLEKEALARYKIWSTDGVKCSGKWKRSICIFGTKELPGLTKAPHLFSNKHHSDYQPVTLDCLEKWLFDKIHNEQQGKSSNINLSFYMNQDFVRNQIP
ncbi:hypothetical protein SNE40_016739 [Patella caerulea]|uniref:Uncharacterized protein n=1 Tax=Patella caerulea TaxID=87958 RepID=A0AAN8JFA4_PATCE